MGARCCCCWHTHEDYTSHIETYNAPGTFPLPHQPSDDYGYTPRLDEHDHATLLSGRPYNDPDGAHIDEHDTLGDFDDDLDITQPTATNLTEEQIQRLIQKQVQEQLPKFLKTVTQAIVVACTTLCLFASH